MKNEHILLYNRVLEEHMKTYTNTCISQTLVLFRNEFTL